MGAEGARFGLDWRWRGRKSAGARRGKAMATENTIATRHATTISDRWSFKPIVTELGRWPFLQMKVVAFLIPQRVATPAGLHLFSLISREPSPFDNEGSGRKV